MPAALAASAGAVLRGAELDQTPASRWSRLRHPLIWRSSRKTISIEPILAQHGVGISARIYPESPAVPVPVEQAIKALLPEGWKFARMALVAFYICWRIPDQPTHSGGGQRDVL